MTQSLYVKSRMIQITLGEYFHKLLASSKNCSVDIHVGLKMYTHKYFHELNLLKSIHNKQNILN